MRGIVAGATRLQAETAPSTTGYTCGVPVKFAGGSRRLWWPCPKTRGSSRWGNFSRWQRERRRERARERDVFFLDVEEKKVLDVEDKNLIPFHPNKFLEGGERKKFWNFLRVKVKKCILEILEAKKRKKKMRGGKTKLNKIIASKNKSFRSERAGFLELGVRHSDAHRKKSMKMKNRKFLCEKMEHFSMWKKKLLKMKKKIVDMETIIFLDVKK